MDSTCDYPPSGSRTDTITILFTDMVGSSDMKDRWGDAKALAMWQRHRELLTRAATETAGRPIRTEGDSWIFIFDRGPDAIRFALGANVLHRFDESIPGFAETVQFRVGIHIGTLFLIPAEEEPAGRIADIQGQAADMAARIMSIAEGGRILCSLPVFDDGRHALKGVDIPGVDRLTWRHHGPYRMKGREMAIGIGEVSEADREPFPRPRGNSKCHPLPAEGEEELPGWRPGRDVAIAGTDWELDRRLGEGGFGEVWLARDRSDPSVTTVFKFCTSRTKVNGLRRELGIFRRLDRRLQSDMPVVRVRNAHTREPPFYLQIDFFPDGDLRQWSTHVLSRHGQGRSPEWVLRLRLDMAVQMARLVDALHTEGIVHRDLKPSNFLLSPGVDPEGPPRLWLTDFGIGHILFSETTESEGSLLPGDGTLVAAAGTFFFIAPELTSRTTSSADLAPAATAAADVYSLGVTLFQLFSGRADLPPGVDLADVEDPVIRRDIKACLRRRPERRPGAAELAEWFSRYDERRQKVKRCAGCGEVNDDDARFCDQCGRPLR